MFICSEILYDKCTITYSSLWGGLIIIIYIWLIFQMISLIILNIFYFGNLSSSSKKKIKKTSKIYIFYNN